MRTCSVDECGKPHEALGFCQMHYLRIKKFGSTELPPKAELKCTADDCPRVAHARGLCAKHYDRVRKNGSTYRPEREPFRELDGELWKDIPGYAGDYRASSTGRVYSRITQIELKQFRQKGGYLRVRLNGRNRMVHQLVLETFVGPKRSDDHQACHNNGDPGDNRLENLRWDTPAGNMGDKKAHGTDHFSNLTHCKHGHPLSGDNLYVSPKGFRNCRTCRSEAERKSRERRRAVRGE